MRALGVAGHQRHSKQCLPASPPCSAATDGEVDRGARLLPQSHSLERMSRAAALAGWHARLLSDSTPPCRPALHSLQRSCLLPPIKQLPPSSPQPPPSLPTDGYCIVEVQISAHHTGAPLALPGLPEVPPSGRRVALEPEFLRVRVEGERIREIVVRGRGRGTGMGWDGMGMGMGWKGQ